MTGEVKAALPDAPVAVVVMGVSASGKSSLAAALADRIALPWLDADELHPPANVAKMASGVPLDDDDRAPWLDAVGVRLAEGRSTGGVVIACSALKRAYRDRLRAACSGTLFVHLDGTRDLLFARAAARCGHFMPATLLDSQLATLEPLQCDEDGAVIDTAADLVDIVAELVEWMRTHD